MTSPPPDGNIAALVSQVLVEQGKQGIQLAHIEEKLNTALATASDHENRIRVNEAAIPPNLEARLSSLENARARTVGAAMVLSLVASAGGTWLGIFITHH